MCYIQCNLPFVAALILTPSGVVCFIPMSVKNSWYKTWSPSVCDNSTFVLLRLQGCPGAASDYDDDAVAARESVLVEVSEGAAAADDKLHRTDSEIWMYKG